MTQPKQPITKRDIDRAAPQIHRATPAHAEARNPANHAMNASTTERLDRINAALCHVARMQDFFRAVGPEPMNYAIRLRMEAVPTDDPRWQYELPQELFQTACELGFDRLHGLTLFSAPPAQS